MKKNYQACFTTCRLANQTLLGIYYYLLLLLVENCPALTEQFKYETKHMFYILPDTIKIDFYKLPTSYNGELDT